MGLLDALRTGRSGLRLASTGLAVTGQNVTNASTEGYSRRTLARSTADPVIRSGLLLGQGVRATGVANSVDRFVNSNLVDAEGRQSRSAATLETMTSVESMFSLDSSGGIAETYTAFFEALRGLSADPADLSRRSAAVGAAESFTNSVRETDTNLNRTLDAIQQEFAEAMDRLNAQFDAIAQLNERIAASSSVGGNADAADTLMATVESLADAVGVKAVFGSDGTATVMLGGHAVVSGGAARTLSVEQDSDGLPAVKLSADSGQIDVTSELGGKLGGRMDAVDVVDAVRQELDAFVATFADAMNAVHQGGFDRDGDPGGDLFSYDSMGPAASFQVDSAVADDERLLALAGVASAYAGDGDNLTQLLGIEQSDLFDDGTKTGAEAVSSLYSTVGRALSRAETDTDVHQAQALDLQALRDAISGVDLDEEATDLMGWQSAYQASARVVTTANQMMGELMDLVL